MKHLLEKLEQQINALQTDTKLNLSTRDIHASPLIHLHIRTPILRKYQFHEIIEFNNLRKLEFFDYVIKHSNISSVLTWVFFNCEKLKTDFIIQNQNTFKTWSAFIKYWEQSDRLCSIYSKILEHDPNFLDFLKSLNQSQNPWERRISIVSLIYYSNSKKKYPDFQTLIPLVHNLLNDKDYYVQKGVGWTIRELHNIYPQQTKKYLFENITKISSHAFTTATEKIDKNFKTTLKEMRKSYL